MTSPPRTLGLRRWLPALGPLVFAAGCNQLAPGINPIASDPPSYANYGPAAAESEAAPQPWRGGSSTDEAGSAALVSQPAAAAASASAADQPSRDRYVARQFPQDYSAPSAGGGSSYLPPPRYQPPSIGTQGPSDPPSVQAAPNLQPAPSLQAAPGQVPAGMPGTSGANQPPSQYQAPSQYQPPPSGYQVLPPPAQPEALSSPSDVVPFFPGGPVADAIYGPQSSLDPYLGTPSPPPVYTPNTRMADLELTGVPARTGRIMFGGAVNSDAGVSGQITVDERNFDITRWPTSFQDFANGTAFRGAGQTFRIEAVPGSDFKRYTASFADPNLLGYMPVSLGVSGFLYDRRFNDYDEERLGGRVSLGYRVTPDLSLSTGITGQNVKIHRPRVPGVPALDRVLGDNELYTGEIKLTHDTRDSPFQPSEGHFLEFGYERAFGDFDYNRFDIENRNYLLVAQRADGSGKQTLSLGTRLGFSGSETPLFENYFAGGYSTLRGFDFRGASPVDGGVQVGGRFQWLNTLEYMFPITADDAFRGVAFVDFGTVERDIEIHKDNFRVAPGLGLRVAIPMLGPAPLAFDFAYPVTKADTDERRIFSFYMSAIR